MNEPNNNQNNVNNGNVLPAGATFVVPGQEPKPAQNNMTLGAMINNQQQKAPAAALPEAQPQAINPQPINSAPMPGTLASMVNNQTAVTPSAPQQAAPVNQQQKAPAGIASVVNATPAGPTAPANPGPITPGQVPPVTPPTGQTPTPPNEGEKPKSKFFDSSKKSNIIALALIVLILVGGGIGALFLFVFDSPSKAFSKAYDDFLTATEVTSQTDSNTYYNYDLALSVSSSNENYKGIIDLINNLKFNFTVGKDGNNRAVMLGMFTYEDEVILNYSSVVDNGAIYVKVNNLLDKVIKLETTTEEDSEEAFSLNYDFDLADYNLIRVEFFKALKEALNQVKYDKSMTKYNGSNVKKYSFNIDTEFTTILYNLLSGNKAFLSSLGRVTNDLEPLESLNNALKELAGKGYVVTVYAGLFKGDIQAISIGNNTNEIVIKPSDGAYDIEFNENGEMLYTGSFSYSRSGDDVNSTFTFNVVSDGTSISIKSLKTKMDAPEALDITGAVSIDELTDEDMAGVTERVAKSDGIQKVSEAISEVMQGLLAGAMADDNISSSQVIVTSDADDLEADED